MKTSSIRIRIEETEKARIEAFATRKDRTVSDIVRQAAASAISGETPGAKERIACAALRRSANRLLVVMENTPFELESLRSAALDLRIAARELVQCR